MSEHQLRYAAQDEPSHPFVTAVCSCGGWSMKGYDLGAIARAFRLHVRPESA